MVFPSDDDRRYWWNDYLAEWIPALTDIHSVTTVQGYEWLPSKYEARISDYNFLRSCQNVAPKCVFDWEDNNSTNIDYLIMDEYINRPNAFYLFNHNNRFELVYQNEKAAVFVRK